MIEEPYLINPPRRIGSSKLSRIMKRAARLRRQGFSNREAMRKAWAGNPNGGESTMQELLVVNPRRRGRRRLRRNEPRRRRAGARRRRNPIALANPRRRRFAKIRKARRGMSLGMIKFPALVEVAALTGGAMAARVLPDMLAKFVPFFGGKMGKLVAIAGVGLGGAVVVNMILRDRVAAKAFSLGALAIGTVGLAEALLGLAKGAGVAGLGQDQYPELGVYTPPQVGGLDIYTPPTVGAGY